MQFTATVQERWGRLGIGGGAREDGWGRFGVTRSLTVPAHVSIPRASGICRLLSYHTCSFAQGYSQLPHACLRCSNGHAHESSLKQSSETAACCLRGCPWLQLQCAALTCTPAILSQHFDPSCKQSVATTVHGRRQIRDWLGS
jgi:hypothetical protein